MNDLEEHIGMLFTAELQFRLASAVRLAVTLGNQPLDLPTTWTHGKHHVSYTEVALRPDQADYAACFMHRSATYLMAIAIRNALQKTIGNPKAHSDPNIRAAYQIARLIRKCVRSQPIRPRVVDR